MKFFVSFLLQASVISILRATHLFSEEDIRMLLPFITHVPIPTCPPNELYRTCTGKCSDCTRRDKCVITKCIGECDCFPHFYRVTPDGPCEPVANCPQPECGENESYRECGPVCESCAYNPCQKVSCEHTCYCKTGYRRNKEGACIPQEECPPRTRCSRTEVLAESGPVDEFCKQNEKMSNQTKNVQQCYCKEGYKRSDWGNCIPESKCSEKNKCLGVEVLYDCIPKCNTTCRNYGNANCTEDDNCYPGCFCPLGYVMNDFLSCIPVGNCSLDIEQVKVINEYYEDEEEGTVENVSALSPTANCTTTTGAINSTSESTKDVSGNPAEMTPISTEKYVTIPISPTQAPTTGKPLKSEESLKTVKSTEQITQSTTTRKPEESKNLTKTTEVIRQTMQATSTRKSEESEKPSKTSEDTRQTTQSTSTKKPEESEKSSKTSGDTGQTTQATSARKSEESEKSSKTSEDTRETTKATSARRPEESEKSLKTSEDTIETVQITTTRKPEENVKPFKIDEVTSQTTHETSTRKSEESETSPKGDKTVVKTSIKNKTKLKEILTPAIPDADDISNDEI